MAVRYYDEDVVSKLNNKRKLTSILKQVVQKYLPEREKIDLTYVFCSDEALLKKNIAFLNHDTYTDILTFDLSEEETSLTAEIYISADRVKENAEKFKVSYQNELHRVIFHGLLHLCGYQDHSAEEQKEMRMREQECLNLYFEANDGKA